MYSGGGVEGSLGTRDKVMECEREEEGRKKEARRGKQAVLEGQADKRTGVALQEPVGGVMSKRPCLIHTLPAGVDTHWGRRSGQVCRLLIVEWNHLVPTE